MAADVRNGAYRSPIEAALGFSPAVPVPFVTARSRYPTQVSQRAERCGAVRRGAAPVASVALAPAMSGTRDDEYPSLEYEEDVYYSHKPGATPSFDAEDVDDGYSGEVDTEAARRLLADEDLDECLALAASRGLDVDTDNGEVAIDVSECYCVETEFAPAPKGKLFVRVSFQDLSKPYVSKISCSSNYRRFLQLVREDPASGEMSPDGIPNELAGLTAEEAEAKREEWRKELAAIEEDIQALRSVLAKRVKDAQDVKRKLGVSVWKEFTEDVSHGLRTAKESNMYQKTESVVKATAEKTTSILGGLGMGISQKLGQLKNSESFRSLEEKMGSAYENVKTKVSTSRSSSIVSFDGALRDGERKSSTATTPTIPEARTPPS